MVQQDVSLVRRDTRVHTCVLSLLALSEERLFRECGQL